MFSLIENQDFFLSLLRVNLLAQLSSAQMGRASSRVCEGRVQSEPRTAKLSVLGLCGVGRPGICIIWGHIGKLL